jgi:cyanate permease
VVFASIMAGVVMLPALLFVPASYVVPLLIMGGLIGGLAPGPVVAMPGQILQPEARAFGTGVFYSIYYALMMIAPPLAGVIADLTDDVSTAFPFGAVMLIIAILALLGFQRTKRPISSA